MALTVIDTATIERPVGYPAFQEIRGLSTVLGARAVFDPDNPDTWTLRDDAGTTRYTAIADGLGNEPDLAQSNTSFQPARTTTAGRRMIDTRDSADRGFMFSDFLSDITQPNTIVVVSGWLGGSNRYLFNAQGNELADLGGRQIMGSQGSSSNFEMWASSWISGSAMDMNFHVWQAIFDGTESELWIDETRVATGDPGANGLGGVGILGQVDGTGTLQQDWPGETGPAIVFPVRKEHSELADLRRALNFFYPIGESV